jgi:transposase InsO family protein
MSPEVESLAATYPNLFSGRIGLLKDHVVKLYIDESVRPVYQRFRPVPLHLQELVEAEIKAMLEQGVIEPATGPTPWVSAIVPVPKPGKPGQIRICTDNRMANKAILPCRHVCPTIEEVAMRLNGAAFVSKLDLKAAFQQLALDTDSQAITTFATHLGLFRYLRLNYGINTASHELQKALELVLSGLKGCFNLADDVLVFGATQEEHDANLHAVLKRLEASGLTLNATKCEISKSEIDFFGLHFSAQGISITTEKHTALTQAADPTSPSELRSLLGLASYCAPFIPNLSTLVDNLRKLTTEGVEWVWGHQQQQEVRKLKEAIVTTALAYFQKEWTTVITVDASPVGLGCVLAQHPPGRQDQTRVVKYMSRSLTPVERRYSQVEREALAVVWACERNHFYLLNNEFILRTDNKAVQLLFGNAASKPRGRIERWALRMLPYRFRIVHIGGSGNIADYISRNPVEEEVTADDHELIAERYVNMISEVCRPRALSRAELIAATSTDAVLQHAIAMIRERSLPASGPYRLVRDELTVTNDGLLLRDNRILIPASLQNHVVKIAHGGHLGVVKTKQLLRQHVWFSGLEGLVDRAVRSCQECLANTKVDSATPTIPSQSARKPWQNLSADFYGPLRDGRYLLVVIDDFSRYPICREVSSQSATKVLPVLRRIFSEFGVPDKLRTDGGPPFNGYDFRRFAAQEGFRHHRVMPVWAQANGLAERFMRCLGKVVRNASVTGGKWESELEEFLRNYRSTPHSSTGIPPVSLLFQEPAKTTRLPSNPISVTTNAPATANLSQAAAALRATAVSNEEKAMERQKSYNDSYRKAKPSPIEIGDIVLLKRTDRHFKSDSLYEVDPYKVTGLVGTMATIERADGRVLARHVSLLKIKNESDFWSVIQPPLPPQLSAGRANQEPNLIDLHDDSLDNDRDIVIGDDQRSHDSGEDNDDNGLANLFNTAPDVTAADDNVIDNNQHDHSEDGVTEMAESFNTEQGVEAGNEHHENTEQNGDSAEESSSSDSSSEGDYQTEEEQETRPLRRSTRPHVAPQRLNYGPRRKTR